MTPSSDNIVRERILNAAGGYIELGLPDMAWDELHTLPDADRRLPEVQEFILGLLIRENRWEEAVATGHGLCTAPEMPPSIFIHTAFALHELGRTPEARALLLAGPPALRSDPLFHYNMACYLAVAGDLQDAEVCLRTAFQMDPKLRVHACTDPDLRELQGVL
jgi:Flp pilus assembly protein TadD